MGEERVGVGRMRLPICAKAKGKTESSEVQRLSLPLIEYAKCDLCNEVE